VPNEDVTWVGYAEAKQLSSLSRRTLRRLVKNGELRASAKIGRATRIDLHSLEKYMCDHGYAQQLRLFD
jgi:excisionase family DNA binding protein